MLKLRFFASLREALACSEEVVALPADAKTLGALRVILAARGGEWQRLTGSRTLRCAVNQVMADDTAAIADGDEIAFFPPVTGG